MKLNHTIGMRVAAAFRSLLIWESARREGSIISACRTLFWEQNGELCWFGFSLDIFTASITQSIFVTAETQVARIPVSAMRSSVVAGR